MSFPFHYEPNADLSQENPENWKVPRFPESNPSIPWTNERGFLSSYSILRTHHVQSYLSFESYNSNTISASFVRSNLNSTNAAEINMMPCRGDSPAYCERRQVLNLKDRQVRES
jgi:hypothetical protein